MGLSHQDFMRLFDAWAPTYDQTVYSPGAEGFENYPEVLRRVVAALGAPAPAAGGGTPAPVRPGDLVVDVGAGTGNLSLAVAAAGYRVVAVEPSRGMRAEARRKLPPAVAVVDGHFLAIPLPDGAAAAAVSTYAFHHLDDPTKRLGALELARVVRPGGRIVLADIAFANAEARAAFRAELEREGKHDLVAEMDSEYYTTVDVLADAFQAAGCSVGYEQLDRWVWLLVAVRHG